MRWLALFALLLALGPRTATGASLADVQCAAAQTEWAKVSSGTDVVAMRAVIARIPPNCAFRPEAIERLDAVARTAASASHQSQASSAASKAALAHANAAAETAREQASAKADDAAWAIARSANNVAAYDAYLSAYPSGMHLDEATSARTMAEAAAAPPAGTTAPAEANRRGLAAYQAGNYAEAMRWYRIAADQGNARAQETVGFLYESGRGVAPDYREAMRWFRLAEAHGNADARYWIGYLYANGLGEQQNLEAARTWMTRAAAQGVPPAKKWLDQHPQ